VPHGQCVERPANFERKPGFAKSRAGRAGRPVRTGLRCRREIHDPDLTCAEAFHSIITITRPLTPMSRAPKMT